MAKKKEEKIDFKAGADSAKEHAVMPQAPGVEKSLLSMMSIDPTNIISQCIADGLNEEYFYIPAHRILWEIFRKSFDCRNQTACGYGNISKAQIYTFRIMNNFYKFR